MIEGLGIAEAASTIGLTAHTLRYYERIGLAGEPPRGPDGRRRYTEQNLDWLRLITRLRSTGMSIAEMCRYAELVREGPDTVGERRELLESHRDVVRQRIAELQRDLAVIDTKIEKYFATEHSAVAIGTGAIE
ncbi:MAG TPA: MerR family transcriptional regulator [Kineosporiaceae bacterium]|nr:MerR family transcriptional regulator [Kineosporiaceae bacterium]